MTALRLSAMLITVVASLADPAQFLHAQQSSPGQAPATPPKQQTPTPPPHRISRSPLHFALPRREYICAGGSRIVILIETKAARLTLQDHVYNMKQVESATGTKYAEGSVVWSSTGEDGFLVDNADVANPKMLADECHLQSSFPVVAPSTSSIKGTAIFWRLPALPANAVLIVQLRDLTRDADDAASALAEERIPVGGRKSPISFALRYDATKVTAKIPLSVSASISGNGKLLFVLVKAVTVPDITNPGSVRLTLSRATANKGQTPPIPEAPPHF